MKISIITVVKNGMPHLKDSIKSFDLQKYYKKELIIIYSKSKDSTEKYLKSLKNSKYKIYKDKNTGNKFDSINLGIKKSSGQIIGILHSDDIFFSNNILSKINEGFNKYKADGLYGGVYYSSRHNLKKILRIWKPSKFKRENLYFGWMPPHVSLFLKKKIFTKIGFYSNEYKISSDYEFILRILLDKTLLIRSTNFYHNIMRLGGESTRIKDFFLKLKEDYLIIKSFNFTIITLFFKIFLKVNQLFKKKLLDNNYLNNF
jgi:glycosyltransferase